MTQIKHKIKAFLDKNISSGYSVEFMDGDASLRSYARVYDGSKSCILMDASLDPQSMKSFLKVSDILCDSYSIPNIIASDHSFGLSLIEDLGDVSYTKLLKSDGDSEQEVYRYAVELLVDLHKMPAEKYHNKIDCYSTQMLLDEAVLILDWYYPFVMKRDISKKLRKEFVDILFFLLSLLHFKSECLVLRDYHADNLMWLKARSGIKKVGLLDYQDAVIGSYAYDLVSLLEDARRDVKDSVVSNMIDLYIKKSCLDRGQYMIDYNILGAQRNSKILGVFARKFLKNQDLRYLTFLPRVLKYLAQDLQHPALLPLKDWFFKADLLNSDALSKALEVA
jgi:N-acetylmuramate 1-kinase